MSNILENTKIDIYVDFKNKDLIKELGCRWNADKRNWYITKYTTRDNFKKMKQLYHDGIFKFHKEKNIEKWKEEAMYEGLINMIEQADYDYVKQPKRILNICGVKSNERF